MSLGTLMFGTRPRNWGTARGPQGRPGERGSQQGLLLRPGLLPQDRGPYCHGEWVSMESVTSTFAIQMLKTCTKMANIVSGRAVPQCLCPG